MGNKRIINRSVVTCSPITNPSQTPPPHSSCLLPPIHIDPARHRWFYMSGDCLECGQDTQWDGELGSSVCTACGTLSNPTQTTLTSHVDSYETSSGHEVSFTWNLGNPTLKSIRNKDGRALSGQGKDVRHRQNMVSFLVLFWCYFPADADDRSHTSSPLMHSSLPYAVGCLIPGWRAARRHCSVKQ